jgi:hypothetical protein
MRTRPGASLAALVLALVLAAPARGADPIMRLKDVRKGMKCTGLSVVRGTTISSFDVEVLDVISGDPSTSGPRILVRVSGPAVDATGIGPGFSGSPVLCRDSAGVRRNAGAISESVGEFGNEVVLATPIEEILGESPRPPAGTRSDPALRRAARPLATPLTVTGLSRRPRVLLAGAARRAGVAVLAAPAGPLGGYPVQTLRPGASVTASLASGDIGLGAVGTVAYRDGQNVWAFGHPLDAAGPRSLFLQDAYVFGVISNPLTIPEVSGGTYKLATSSGHTLGTLTNDANAAVVGRLGTPPGSVGLEASARESGTRRSKFVSARLADERALGLGAGAAVAAPLAAAQAIDGVVRSAAPVTLSLCLRFRVAERRRGFGYCNSYFSAETALFDLTDAAALVESYDVTPLGLRELTVRVRLRRGVKEDVLLRGRALRRVRPGQRVRVRLAVRRRGTGARRRLTIRFRVPRSVRPGRRAVVLTGTGRGSGEDAIELITVELAEALFGDGETDEESAGPRSVGELVALVRSLRRKVGIRARFRRRGRARVVYESGRVAFSGRVRVPLRVVRRRR